MDSFPDKNLLDRKVQEFITAHTGGDTASLALKYKSIGETPIGPILEQIRARAIALRKMPSWTSRSGIYYPPVISMEQCSSEQTARFKLQYIPAGHVADLTGGAGVDSLNFSEKAEKVTFVEQQQGLCSIARHNAEVMGITNLEILCDTAENYLGKMNDVDLLYMDPSRRTGKGKIFLLEDCEPNITDLWDGIKSRSSSQLIKLSPMMDVSSVFRYLGGDIRIILLSVSNEMKELLVYRGMVGSPGEIQCVDLKGDEVIEFTFNPEKELNSKSVLSEPLDHIYEPNAAIMKGGAFKLVGLQFNLHKLAENTHLYTSRDHIHGFPGRTFKLREVLPATRKIKLPRANIAVRNFPIGAEDLRKKLKIAPGGDDYIYGCTLSSGKRVLLIMERMS